MLTPPPKPADPAARVAVRVIFGEISYELQRRIALHQSLFQKVWFSTEYTPQEFFDECGTQGRKFLEVAGANVEHIAILAALDDKTLNDLMAQSEYAPPVPYTINSDGTVTLN